MKFETQFPEGFPEVGDVIRFTCKATTVHERWHVTAEQITGKKNWSTVEVMVIGRDFDEATDLHHLITSDDTHKYIRNLDGWESEGWMLTDTKSGHGLQLEKYRAKIHKLEVVRKHP